MFSSIAMAADLKMVSHPTMYPWSWKKDGKFDGLAIRVIDQIAKNLNHKIEHKDLPWKRAFMACKKGEIDLLGAVAQNPDRLKKWSMSKGYSVITWEIFSKTKIDSWSELNSLQGVGIAGVDYNFAPKVKFNQDKITRVKTGKQLMQMLIGNRVQFVVGATETYNIMLKLMQLPDMFRPYQNLKHPQDISFIFCKKNDKLNKSINQQIDKLKKSGSVKMIEQAMYKSFGL
jgi:ABC-type amino acid transport substrate-binding protein